MPPRTRLHEKVFHAPDEMRTSFVARSADEPLLRAKASAATAPASKATAATAASIQRNLERGAGASGERDRRRAARQELGLVAQDRALELLQFVARLDARAPLSVSRARRYSSSDSACRPER